MNGPGIAVKQAKTECVVVPPFKYEKIVAGFIRFPGAILKDGMLGPEFGDQLIPGKQILIFIAPGIGSPVVGVFKTLYSDLVAVVQAGDAGKGELDQTE
jgi:hypothetical protein